MKIQVISALALLFFFHASSDSQELAIQPIIRTYKTVGQTNLKAHIFMPTTSVKGEPHAAIILLSGGGWNAGSPEWTYDDARRYAESGLVAVSGEYHLSNQKTSRPLRRWRMCGT